jgi:toxin-antitoxin system PIN domain toxin
MIVPDVNILLYAYNDDAPHHSVARSWWENALSETRPVGLAWNVALGYLRLSTHPRVFARPMTPEGACAHVEAWLSQPQVFLLHPGDRHATVLFDLLRRLGTAGNLTGDAHLAALAIEHQAEVHTTDADFARFPGLRWRNPLLP